MTKWAGCYDYKNNRKGVFLVLFPIVLSNPQEDYAHQNVPSLIDSV